MNWFESWQISGRTFFSRHESSIKAEEMQIKRQERSITVIVVLFVNYRVAAEDR